MFLKILDENITEFHKVLNQKISSQEILNEYIKAEGEIFDKIKNHHALLGILLGYGKENSFAFMNDHKNLSSSVDPLSMKNCDMTKIFLPSFKIVKGSNETKKIMDSFEKQQKQIIKIYEKENFLEIVLLKLFCPEEQ